MEPGSTDIRELKAFDLGDIISTGQGIEGIGKLANPPVDNL